MQIERGEDDPERDRAHPERQRRSAAAQQHHPDDHAEEHDHLRLRDLVAHERCTRERRREQQLHFGLGKHERRPVAAEHPSARDRDEDEGGVDQLPDLRSTWSPRAGSAFAN